MALTERGLRFHARPHHWLAAMAVLLGVLACASPAWAQGEAEADPQVVLTGRAEVRPNERSESVVILDGPATISGFVDGAVVALNGDVRVTGTVEEAVVAVNGRAIIENGGRVNGDVVSSRAPEVAPGAVVGGETSRVRFSFRALGTALWIIWWLGVTVSGLIIGLLLLALAPRAMAASLAVARERPGPSVGLGLLVAVGLPVLSVAVLFTVLGIPLGLLGLLSLTLLYSLGYVVAALALGRALIKEPTSLYLAFLAGFAMLRLVGLIPALGGLVTLLATALGLGALAIAGWRAARREPATAPGTVTASA